MHINLLLNKHKMALLISNIFEIQDIVYSINEFIFNDNNLLISNKYLYALRLKYYKLNIKYSLKYCFDIDFKNLINSKIINRTFPIFEIFLIYRYLYSLLKFFFTV